MVKKIILRILLCIPFLFIKNVYAEDLTDIYINFSSNRVVDSISNTSFGDYPTNTINFSTYNDYNVYSQFTANNSTYKHYILFYNKQYDYYVYIVLPYTSNEYVFRILSNGTNSFAMCKNSNDDSLSSSTCIIGYYFNYIYNNVNKLNDIRRIYSYGTLTTKNLDNFYISFYSTGTDSTGCSTNCTKALSSNLVYNIDSFYYIDSDIDFYIDNVKQEKHTYSELNPIPDQEPTTPPFNFNDTKFYVPNYEKGNCVEVLDKDTIRVFSDESTNFYIDYFINSNYISRQGQVDLEYEKHCSTLEFTDIRYYGNDMPQILFILVCILTFTIGFPYVLYKRFRKR